MCHASVLVAAERTGREYTRALDLLGFSLLEQLGLPRLEQLAKARFPTLDGVDTLLAKRCAAARCDVDLVVFTVRVFKIVELDVAAGLGAIGVGAIPSKLDVELIPAALLAAAIDNLEHRYRSMSRDAVRLPWSRRCT